jgi:predicted DNA-binding protein YlxM (UPF0122 family)
LSNEEKTNDYENFEKKNDLYEHFEKKNDLYEHFEKKGGSREKGEEETKSMPHAPVVKIITNQYNQLY